jgi:hypothetical protein
VSALGDKRRKFTVMIAKLIIYADSLGYGIALGRGYASEAANKADGGHLESCHLYGLAQDLHLYEILTGEYITDSRGHDQLHDYWDDMGGAERIDGDMNHYSLEHNGIR